MPTLCPWRRVGSGVSSSDASSALWWSSLWHSTTRTQQLANVTNATDVSLSGAVVHPGGTVDVSLAPAANAGLSIPVSYRAFSTRQIPLSFQLRGSDQEYSLGSFDAVGWAVVPATAGAIFLCGSRLAILSTSLSVRRRYFRTSSGGEDCDGFSASIRLDRDGAPRVPS